MSTAAGDWARISIRATTPGARVCQPSQAALQRTPGTAADLDDPPPLDCLVMGACAPELHWSPAMPPSEPWLPCESLLQTRPFTMTALDSIRGDTVSPDDPAYADAIARWAVSAERRACCVIFPIDTDDIAIALQHARDERLPVVVRGGGHSASGASSVEGGLVIDLSRYFTQVRVDANAKLAYVGGGAIWATVDREGAKHGLATVGGTVNQTGVGGLTLGGGYGWLTGQHGLTIDNLKQATVVLADGSAVTANETSHPDLFWALRGAGPNFGVVTEFVFGLHPQAAIVFAGPLTFTPDKLEALITAAVELHKQQHPRASGAVVFGRSPKTGQPQVVYHLFFNGPKTEAMEIFESIYNIGPHEMQAAEMPYENVNSLLNGTTEVDRRSRYMKGAGWSTMSAETARELFQKYCEHSAGPFASSISVIELYPSSAVNSVPADATAFPARGTHGNQLTICTWLEGPDATVAQARKMAHELTHVVTKAEGATPLYSNYATEVRSGAEELYGKEKYKRLQMVKKRYDPDAVFRTWFPIEPMST